MKAWNWAKTAWSASLLICRTDSTRVSNEALTEVREMIGKDFGPQYLPEHQTFQVEERRAGSARSDSSDRVARHPDSIKQYL